MRHTLIRRFTTDTHKLRRKDADGEDPDERSVPVDEPLAAVDPLTDDLQHTQEKRATPGQENPGILEPMRPSKGSCLPRIMWTILGVSVPPTNPWTAVLNFPSHLGSLSQPSPSFHLIWTISLSTPVTLSRPHAEKAPCFSFPF